MHSQHILCFDSDETDKSSGTYMVTPQGVTIGRAPDSDVYIDHPLVSWCHARVWCIESGCLVADLGSTNGTYVNGVRLDPNYPCLLNQSDDLYIGGRKFVISTFETPAHNHHDDSSTKILRLSDFQKGRPLLIGRSPECDIVLSQPDASWKHARLIREKDKWRLDDLGSTNGTFVNEKRVSTCFIRPDDRITIGLSHFTLNTNTISHDDDRRICLDARGLKQIVMVAGRQKTLLQNVSLSIQPGELAAIVGSSGAGKTTLLLALNGYMPAVFGHVMLNGIDYYMHPDIFRTAIGYVPQSDIVHADLNVERALCYAARLRLPSDTSDKEIASLVTRILNEMGLTAQRYNLIRTLSGGERKRVNIGVELLTRPSILFLDEPTTGLDAGLERRIVHQLRALADNGCTLVVVTHSVQTIEEYDKVAVMTRGGYLAYLGPPKKALKFFGVSSYAEMYDAVSDTSKAEDYWAARFNASVEGRLLRKATPAPTAHKTSSPPRVNPVRQLSTLIARYCDVIRGDVRNMSFWLLQAPIIAFILIVIFDRRVMVGDDIKVLPDGTHLLFLLSFSVFCFSLFNASREIVKEKAIYHRERHVGLEVVPYLVSRLVVLGMISATQCLLLLLITAGKVDYGGIANMSRLFGVIFLGSLNATLLGLLISAWASTSDQAISLAAFVLLIQVIFSGLIPLERLGTILSLICSICALRWSYGGLCAVMDVPTRWADAGLSEQIQEIFRTSGTTAFGAMISLICITFIISLMVLSSRDRLRN